MTYMKKNDYYKVGFLMLIPILIFLPLFYTSYFYTDEVLQLWLYRKGSSFAMFVPQGRLFTDGLFRFFYSRIDTISQLRRLRLFSLVGWLISLPVWYAVFVRVSKDQGLPPQLPFFSTLFLVCSLPFGISIQWAACMELFIANTCGLLAGYFVYRYDRRGWLPALLFGLASLFFYQNGFGCFLLPFFLQLVARQKADRKMLQAVLVYFTIYLVYFLVFKGLMKWVLYAGVTDRAALMTDPFAKGYFLLMKALPQAFCFNAVVYERSIIGRISFGLITGVCLWLNYRAGSVRNFLVYVLLVFGCFVLIYLPSMIIHENYSSNRTLLGLDMAVFTWVFVTLVRRIGGRLLPIVLQVTGCLSVVTAFNNFRFIFLSPAADEYGTLKTFIDKNYGEQVTSIDYIRAPEDVVRNKYGIRSSWDEYGLSSSYFAWVPDAVTRQLVFEKTGDRGLAEKLTIRVWPDRQAWQAAGQPVKQGVLTIDAPTILRK